MNNENTDFEPWFDFIVEAVAKTGHRFSDPDSVRDDYEQGKPADEVAADIIEEYS